MWSNTVFRVWYKTEQFIFGAADTIRVNVSKWHIQTQNAVSHSEDNFPTPLSTFHLLVLSSAARL